MGKNKKRQNQNTYITENGAQTLSILTREKYKELKRMDRPQVDAFLLSVFEQAFMEGKAYAEKNFKKETQPINFEQFKQILLGIKGVGEVKANQIIEALSKAGEK